MSLSDPNLPAWVQAVGSVLAIVVAIWIPAQQRSNAIRDALAERVSQKREHLARLTVGLRAEIKAALEAADRQTYSIQRTLDAVQDAIQRGIEPLDTGGIQPGSMVTTDAIVYRQVAAELGQFPTELIRSIVLFYTFALDIGDLRIAHRRR